jgi:hypothetical protein
MAYNPLPITNPSPTETWNLLNKIPPSQAGLAYLNKLSQTPDPANPDLQTTANVVLAAKTNQEKQAQAAMAKPPQGTVMDNVRAQASAIAAQEAAKKQQELHNLLGLGGISDSIGHATPSISPQENPALQTMPEGPQNPQQILQPPSAQQAPQTVMAAKGGLMNLPVGHHMFNYKTGGVIGFDGATAGSSVPDPFNMSADQIKQYASDLLKSRQGTAAPMAAAEAESTLPSMLGNVAKGVGKALGPLAMLGSELFYTSPEDIAILKAAENKKNASALEQERNKNMAIVNADNMGRPTAPGIYPQAVPEPGVDVVGANPPATPEAQPSAAPSPVVGGAPRPIAGGRPVAVPTKPAFQPTDVSTLNQATPEMTDLQQRAIAATKGPTHQDLLDKIAMDKEVAKAYGTDTPVGKAAMDRIEQYNKMYQTSIADRPMERLMKVLGAMSVGGLRGAGPGYLSAVEGERKADLDQALKINELMTPIETEQFKQSAARAKNVFDAFGKDKESAATAAVSMQREAMSNMSAEKREALRIQAEERMKQADIASREKVAALERAVQQGKTFSDRELMDMYKNADPKLSDIEIINRIALYHSPSAALNAPKLDLAEARALQTSLKDQLTNTYDKATREAITKQLNEVNAKIAGTLGLSSGAPQVGEVRQGYKFKGGNPSDQNNWEKV